MIIAIAGSDQAARMLISLMRTSNKWPKGVSHATDWSVVDQLVANGVAVIVPVRSTFPCKHARDRKAVTLGVISDPDIAAWDEHIEPTKDLNVLWSKVEAIAVKRGWI